MASITIPGGKTYDEIYGSRGRYSYLNNIVNAIDIYGALRKQKEANEAKAADEAYRARAEARDIAYNAARLKDLEQKYRIAEQKFKQYEKEQQDLEDADLTAAEQARLWSIAKGETTPPLLTPSQEKQDAAWVALYRGMTPDEVKNAEKLTNVIIKIEEEKRNKKEQGYDILKAESDADLAKQHAARYFKLTPSILKEADAKARRAVSDADTAKSKSKVQKETQKAQITESIKKAEKSELGAIAAEQKRITEDKERRKNQAQQNRLNLMMGVGLTPNLPEDYLGDPEIGGRLEAWQAGAQEPDLELIEEAHKQYSAAGGKLTGEQREIAGLADAAAGFWKRMEESAGVTPKELQGTLTEYIKNVAKNITKYGDWKDKLDVVEQNQIVDNLVRAAMELSKENPNLNPYDIYTDLKSHPNNYVDFTDVDGKDDAAPMSVEEIKVKYRGGNKAAVDIPGENAADMNRLSDKDINIGAKKLQKYGGSSSAR